MILYLDASALVTLYVTEANSEQVRQWVGSAEILASSRISRVEIAAALARRQRDGALTADEVDRVRAAFGADWDDYVALDVDEAAAADMARHHPLRALDAIHLAAALGLAAAPELTDTAASAALRFASFDERQRAAAAAEGLAVLPAEPPPP
jgi:predicted nucleic acid-binding protein